MSDKWRFDPNRDYTADEEDYGNRRGNFQRFKNRNKKKRSRFNDNNSDDEDTRGKRNSWR